jgi:DNA-directed RNA polymerase
VDLLELQHTIEEKALLDAQNKYDNVHMRMRSVGMFGTTTEGVLLKKLAIDNVIEAIEAYMAKKVRGHNAKTHQFFTENFSGRADVLGVTILESILSWVGANRNGLTAMTIHVANDIINLLSVEEFKKNEPKFYSYLEYEYKKRGIGYVTSRKLKLAQKTGNAYDMEARFKASIGSIMLNCVISSGANILKIYKVNSGRNVERHITLTDEAVEILYNVRNRGILNNILYKPLVVCPEDWTHIYDTGGYKKQNPLVFIKHNRSRKALDMIEKMDVDLTRFYNVVNGIQKTKWKINTEIMDVMNAIIDGNMTNPEYPESNPVLYGNIPYMESIDVYQRVPKASFGELDEKGTHVKLEDYKAWFTAKEIQLKKLEALKSKRIMFILALDIAKEYSQYDEFYFSYSVDFRGRLYPIQQIFNPQSTGAIKALLQFADAEQLTDDGRKWLAIHIANTYGHDKLSYEDRETWTLLQRENLIKYANNPLSYLKEWNEADDPLMFLAGCMALRDDFEGKPVSLPISLDGTCSGLQIYSGLLKDKEGAEAVNVVNNDSNKPADVYTDVAVGVQRYLETGDYQSKFTFTTTDGETRSCNTFIEAEDLKGNVTRSLTKRNVMTVPYSVTKRGMYDQVRELLDEMEDNEKSFWKGDKWVVAKLLVELNSRAIAEVVSGATVGQDFIKSVVYDFYHGGKPHDKPLVWHTPFFNFPVIQWRTKLTQKRVKTVLGNLSLRYPTNKINKQQQNNGVAPNFIHSLDSTLMYLTMEKLMEQGISDFMLIHDSFGVSANAVEQLNSAIRHSYVELFEAEPLRDWVAQVYPERLGEVDDVMIDTLDLKEVLESKYIFS